MEAIFEVLGLCPRTEMLCDFQRRDQKVRGKAEGYTWYETEKTMALYINISQDTRADQVR